MAWTQSGNIKGASGTPGASGATGPAGPTGATGASGGTGGTGGPGTTNWADIVDKPGAILNYKGTWNASTNSPTLSDSTGSGGDVYRVSVGGTRNLGSGSIVWDVSDYAIYSPVTSSWEKADTTDAVSSVNTRTGDITLSYLDIGASGTPSGSNFLRGDGSWSAGPIGATGATGASGSTGGTGGLGASGPGFYRDISTVTASTTLGASGNTDYVVFANIAATGDPNYPSVTALLTGDGSNNSTTITDSSTLASNWTAYGNAKLSTGTKKFGTASISLDGTNSYVLSSAATTNFTFSTSPFTIEMWIYPTNASSGLQLLYDPRPSAQGSYPVIYLNGGSLRYFVNSADRITGSTLSNNTWYHIAVCRSGTSTRMFIDGAQTGSTYTDSTDYISSNVTIGRNTGDANGYFFQGFVDDARVTKNIARYTANFTAPSAALPTSGGLGTITLPTATGGTKNLYSVVNIHGTDTVQLASTSSQTINGASPGTLATGAKLTVVSDGSNWRSPW